MTKRPNLAAAIKTAAHGSPVAAAPLPTSEARGAPPGKRSGAARAPSREGKKAVYAWLDPAHHRRLRTMALDTERSVDALVGEAVLKLLSDNGYLK